MYQPLTPYAEARAIHAFMLRIEGLTYRAIGRRLGVGIMAATGTVAKGARRFQRGLNRSVLIKEINKEHFSD